MSARNSPNLRREQACQLFICNRWFIRAQMENIQLFLNFCESYGVPKTGLFQTVDLYEGRNLPQVLNCIQQLGTEVA